jgi:type II secretory pathway pseudopilin PulG
LRPSPQSLPQPIAGEAGFSLLEGLVAIALLAGTMVAIFALVGGILNSANNVGRSNQTVQVTLNALEVMTTVNPMLQGLGKIDLGTYTVSWKSAATTPVSDGTGYPRGISLYQLALYETDIRVEDQPGTLLAAFKLRQVGYRRVREPPSPFPGAIPGVAAQAR